MRNVKYEITRNNILYNIYVSYHTYHAITFGQVNDNLRDNLLIGSKFFNEYISLTLNKNEYILRCKKYLWCFLCLIKNNY